MRAAAATVVGLLVGGLLGFVVRGWCVEDAARAEPTRASSEPGTATGSALPAVARGPAEVLRPAPAEAARPRPAPSGAADAAADALVGLLVYGAVLDPDGLPATLGTRRTLRFDRGAGEPLAIEVPETSTYAVSGLAPGRCTVQLDTQGYRPYRHELVLDAAQPAVRLDIVLEPAVVLLVKAFTPSGERLGDALKAAMGPGATADPPLAAVASREPPPASLPEISHRLYDRWGLGTFSSALELMFANVALPEDTIGRLELDEALPAHVSLLFRHLVVATQTVDPGATEVVFVVPVDSVARLLGEVRVRVVDSETGEPVTNAHGELTDSQSGGGNAQPDATGLFRWERQRPGRLELRISATDHEEWNGEISVPPGGVADLGTLELTAAASISGVVLDEAGQPVATTLRPLPDEARPLGMGARRYNKSGADGRFECPRLGRRLHVLVVSDDEWAGRPVPVDLRQGSVEGVIVTVGRGTRARLNTRWPAAERRGVQLLTGDGLPIERGDWRGDWAWTRRLLPGEYVAIVSDAGRELARVPFRVGADDVTVELAP